VQVGTEYLLSLEGEGWGEGEQATGIDLN
jgi:hypothetical protein